MFGIERTSGMLVTVIVLSALVFAPVVGADGDQTRARTSDGGCVMVDQSTSPATATSTTGCQPDDPCVYVDWTTTPPEVATGSYC